VGHREPGAFLELIALGDDFAPPRPDAAVYPFAGFLAGYLGRREGLAMTAMRSADASADRRAFEAAGIGGRPQFDFARKGRRPDGREVEVAFSLAFAATPALPEAGFFVCQQHFPQNFWSPTAQIHPNGALAVAGLTLVHERPADATAFLAAFLDAPARSIADGLTFAIAGGAAECLTPAGFFARYGAPPGGPGLAAARIATADRAACSRLLVDNRVPTRARDDMTIVDATTNMGLLLAFV
jgi:hypothetical protein